MATTKKTTLTPIQKTIAEYMRGKELPSARDLRCFAGMIQTGEANLSDFLMAGGDKLMDAVADYTAGEGWRNT